MLNPKLPALVLAPMEGITDAPMRALLGASGAFTYAVSEFLRVSGAPLPSRVFHREVPELLQGGCTPSGMPVQVQILGGHPGHMATSAAAGYRAGAAAIDINFGCPVPSVNNHDGGAALLKHPSRIREIVAAVRAAVPAHIPVSAKLRLGWDSAQALDENAAMAAEGGAAWLTIHARTRSQGYAPPVYWKPIGRVRAALNLPIIANGDIWSLDHFHLCREQTGCNHFMLGRSALANPALPYQIARELGIATARQGPDRDWSTLLRSLVQHSQDYGKTTPSQMLKRLKQWLSLASKFGGFPHFDRLKTAQTLEEFFSGLSTTEVIAVPGWAAAW